MEKEKKICLRDRDVELLFFLSDYSVISNENVKLIYKSEYYYKNRLASLAKGDMIERLYGKVILGTKGKRFLNEIGFGYRNVNRVERYKERMERVSDIACKFKDCDWSFEPSWKCEINTYTKRGNRFIGIASRRERFFGEDTEDFNKMAYLVYYLHKNITSRELKYIDKEIDRNKSNFKGIIVFTENEEYLYKPKFDKINYEENYIIPYNQETWKVFKLINDQTFMNQKIYEIFGDKLISLREKSFVDKYYYKENNDYIYVYYMPFANFNLMNYLNFVSTEKQLFPRDKVKVVCLENCVEYARKYLNEEVEIISININ